MAKLFGRELTKEFVMERVGEISQIGGIRASTLNGGAAEGVRCLDFRTGSGFNFSVLPDRAMDIAWADFRGVSLGYMTSTGVVAPQYYVEDGEKGFLRNFFAGLMSTGGLTNIGIPCEDDGESLVLHGVIGNRPAEDVSVFQDWDGDEYVMEVRGRVRQSRFKGENLVLRRTITTRLGSQHLAIHDEVENRGFNRQPFAILYHINFGFPIVAEDTRLHTPEGDIRPRTEVARGGLDKYATFQEPTAGYQEQVFYHELKPNARGETYACLFNPALGSDGLGACVKYRPEQLPLLTEWKELGQGAYAVGLEPCTTHLEGRDVLRREGNLEFLEPGETRTFDVTISVIDGQNELKNLKQGAEK